MSKFEESWRRLKRARFHKESFQREWMSLLNGNDQEFLIEMESATIGVVRVRFSKPFEHDLALTLGEFFYQLRAALDGAVYRAACLFEKTENPTRGTKLEFPIYPGAVQFKNAAINKGPFHKQLRLWLENVQPYNSIRTAGTPDEGLNAHLSLLHDCARKDRHRQLHIIGVIPTALEAKLSLPVGVSLVKYAILPIILSEHFADLLRFTVEGFTPEMEMNLRGDLTIDVSVEELPGVFGASVIQKLGAITSAVEWVLRRFEQTFEF